MTASPAGLDGFTAAGGNGGGAGLRVAARTPSRPVGADLAAEVRFVMAAGSAPGGLRSAMARAGAILLQSGLETPDAAKVDSSVDIRTRARARHAATHPAGTSPPLRRRTRRYAERRAAALR